MRGCEDGVLIMTALRGSRVEDMVEDIQQASRL
jgi:hypothetical protein